MTFIQYVVIIRHTGGCCISYILKLSDLTPEFDYVKISDVLLGYASPRDQITKLLLSKKIIRVKKGLYVLGPEFRKPYSREILANLIYGPSYISGMSALSFYNFIPERVELVSSRTPNRNKRFETPLGKFDYKYIPMSQYFHSIDRVHLDGQRSFLIATPEKVLVEMICHKKTISSVSDLMSWIQSMRIEAEELRKLRVGELQLLQKVFKKKQVDYLLELVRKEKK